MNRSHRCSRLVFVWLIVLTLGCAQPPEPEKRPNFILMMVDTLRADRLHFTGHASIRTPHFDRLQASSTWFANAYTTSPWTLPAVSSLFTAQLSSTHGAINFSSNLPDGALTLAQLLSDSGYRTGAWSASRLIVPARGALQGFDETKLVQHPFHENKLHPVGSPLRVAPASSVSPPAMAWIQRARNDDAGRPFFAYLHYMEPHTPYLCPHERVRDPGCRAEAEALNEKLIKRKWDFDEAELELVGALYDADIERMDREIGDFMARLSAAGVLEDTWVILVADHGELLGERGAFLHGKALYEPLVHVPMLFRAPDAVGRVVETPVSIIDVAPTIAELAGIPQPEVWQGRSLVGALAGETVSERPVVAELYMHDTLSKHRFAIIDGEDKYLLDMSGGVSRVRISEDPGEQHPQPARAEDIERILATAGLSVDLRDLDAREEGELTAEQREQLEALGYLNEDSR